MLAQKTYKNTYSFSLSEKLFDYAQLVKLRLSLLVVFSSVIGYILGSVSGLIDWVGLVWLAIGGLLVTGAANALNQLLEKDSDKLMKRTASRPLPDGRMGADEVLFSSMVMGVSGLMILYVFNNMLAALLALTSLILYVFVYTPLKKRTSLNVFVGAISGGLPLIIGWAAAANTITMYAIMIFAVQFIWQFPHTWSLAWKLDDQYKKARMKMLPSVKGKSKNTAIYIMLYTLFLIPVSIFPAKYGWINSSAAVVILIGGVLFFIQSVKLFRSCSEKDASKLMFASILYLPIIQLALVFGKI